jgi:hypothetical protein
MDRINLDHSYFEGKLTPDEKKQLISLMNKATKPTKEQEREFVEFFKGLIPILIEVYTDLDSKGLCPEELKTLSKYKRQLKT